MTGSDDKGSTPEEVDPERRHLEGVPAVPPYQTPEQIAQQSKENHMKKLIIPAALLVAALAFSGCATKGVTSSPKAEDKPAAAAEAEPTVAPPAPVAEEGTREAPLPYDQEVKIYDVSTNVVLWQITVHPVADVTAEIAGENQFNAAPTNGSYLSIPVHVVWQGAEPIQPWLDFQNGLEFAFVSADGVTYENAFVVSPWPSITDIADLYQGGAADFTIVVDAPAGTPGLVRVQAGSFDYFVGVL